MYIQGRTLPLSLPRRYICDLLHFARKVPSVTVQRHMNLGPLKSLRDSLEVKPSWCAILMKAYALTAAARPVLRRAYLRWPQPHLYEHPMSIASVAFERTYQGEPAVFHEHIRCPDKQSLVNLDGHLWRYKNAPIEEIGLFRRILLVSRLPLPVRRAAWWIGLNSSGPKRAKRMGTFGVSVYSGLGAESLNPCSPLTTTLNYGVIDGDGNVNVRIIYDHRVLDGAEVARALGHMEEILNGMIVSELKELDCQPDRTVRCSVFGVLNDSQRPFSQAKAKS